MINKLIFNRCVSINTIRCVRRYGSFDIFKKLQDSTSNTDENDTDTRKPSSKVIKLVDEILNLTLIEAADLCNLCQEKLSANINKNGNFIPGRHPFPHPNTFFQNVSYVPPGQPFPNNMASTPDESNTQDVTSAPASTESKNVKSSPPKEEKKANVKKSIKLVGFDKEKKIEIIKTIRTLLNINLRESKELIESYPKVIKKNLDPDEVERISKLITDAGGQVEVE